MKLLTTKEVAALLRVHPKHVYRLMRRGLPALRVGDEWRFDRERVLAWARSRGADEPDESQHPTAGLVAANGDRVIDLLLARCARTRAPPIGFVLADHTAGARLLRRRLVLAAGRHAGIASLEENGDAPAPSSPKAIGLQLVEREVGIAAARGARPKGLGALVGKRIAIRPRTSGLRRRLDDALDAAGIAAPAAYRNAFELACHRDVALAVARGDAAYGLTTHAWAQAAGLSFLAVEVEAYDLSFLADHADDPRILALCEAAQSAAFKRLLRSCAGYDPSRAGRVRAG
ncbi:MAG: substrate-binding domain-containing protein [Polyangiaceae bacterium]